MNDSNKFITMTIGIVVAVIVVAVVLVPICNSLAEGNGGSGDGGGSVGDGIAINNFVSYPLEIETPETGITAIDMAGATALFETVSVKDLNGDTVQVKNGTYGVITASGMFGFSSTDDVWGFLPYDNQKWGGVFYLADYPTISEWTVTDWSISSAGVLTAQLEGDDSFGGGGDTVQTTLTEPVEFVIKKSTSGQLYNYGTYGAQGQFIEHTSYGFNAGDSLVLMTSPSVLPPEDEESTTVTMLLPSYWYGTAPDNGIVTVQAKYMEMDYDSGTIVSSGTREVTLDLTVFEKDGYYLYNDDYWTEHGSEIESGEVVAYSIFAGPKTFYAPGGYVNLNLIDLFVAGEENNYVREVNDNGETIYLSYVFGKIGADKYTLNGDEVVNEGPSTASDFQIVTQEGYGVLTVPGVYVEVTEDDDIGVLHVTSYSSALTRARMSAESSVSTVSTGGEMLTVTSGIFAQFTPDANGDYLIWSGVDYSDAQIRKSQDTLPYMIDVVSTMSGSGGNLLPNFSSLIWSETSASVGNPAGSGYVWSREISSLVWGNNVTTAIPMTMDFRYIDLDAESEGGGSDSGGDGSSDLGTVGTIIGIIPIFVILAILMGIVTLSINRDEETF